MLNWVPVPVIVQCQSDCSQAQWKEKRQFVLLWCDQDANPGNCLRNPVPVPSKRNVHPHTHGWTNNILTLQCHYAMTYNALQQIWKCFHFICELCVASLFETKQYILITEVNMHNHHNEEHIWNLTKPSHLHYVIWIAVMIIMFHLLVLNQIKEVFLAKQHFGEQHFDRS